MLFCGRCKKQGRTSRLIFTEARSRTGDYYAYFLCRGRQHGQCDLPHLPADQVEDAVATHYFDLGVGPEFAEAVEQELGDFMAESQEVAMELQAKLSAQLKKLDGQEDRLIDLVADGTISKAKLQQRINSLRVERHRVELALNNTNDELRIGAQRLLEAIKLVAEPAKLYGFASDGLRRNLNQTFFHHFLLDEDDAISVSASVMREPFNDLAAARAVLAQSVTHERGPVTVNGASSRANRGSLMYLKTIGSTRTVVGSSKTVVVPPAGIEPATNRLEGGCSIR